ncbi:hypothetical protein DL96DRAFT_1631047 [Flagelloscypha sp. PMI_526]|nr:hypothetical protein DL96DRAFT_1631047 [Flagelloscypha sp. PMI_526]
MALPISLSTQYLAVQIHDIDRPTLFSLNVVNSNFHSITLPVRLSGMFFELTTGVKPKDLQRLQTWLDYQGNSPGFPMLFVDLLFATSRNRLFSIRLSTFVFSINHAQLPLSLLQALEVNNPNVRLVLCNWNLGNTRDAELDNHLKVLSQTPLLREVRAINKATPHDVTFVALRHFVSLAPKLQKVIICAPHPNDRYQGFCGNAWRGHSEAMARAEARFSLLTNGNHKPLWQEFRHLELTNAPADFAEQCLRIVNPAHLEQLELEIPILTNPTVINPLTFPALRHLALDVYDEQADGIVGRFLQVQCMGASLESFTLRTSYPIPETILPQLLDTHGSTLKTLVLRNDLNHRKYPRPVIPFSPIREESICLIRDACPMLEQLSLCVGRKSEAAVFDALAKFSPNLRHVTLDFGSGCSFVHVPAAAADYFYWQEGADIDTKLKLPSDGIEEWEQMLWLHVPLTSSDVEGMFGGIYKGGNGASSLETLVVRIRHPWASSSQQEFSMQRQSEGTGYDIREGQETALEEERLKVMWAKLCPRREE